MNLLGGLFGSLFQSVVSWLPGPFGIGLQVLSCLLGRFQAAWVGFSIGGCVTGRGPNLPERRFRFFGSISGLLSAGFGYCPATQSFTPKLICSIFSVIFNIFDSWFPFSLTGLLNNYKGLAGKDSYEI